MAEHPIEVARAALLKAAVIETPDLASLLRRIAADLPVRVPLGAGQLPEGNVLAFPPRPMDAA